MSNRVREPLQVYLSAEEREELEHVARAMGVSLSEALRRGIRAVGRVRRGGPLPGLTEEGLVTPAAVPPGEIPPRAPVAPLQRLLEELERDRADR